MKVLFIRVAGNISTLLIGYCSKKFIFIVQDDTNEHQKD